MNRWLSGPAFGDVELGPQGWEQGRRLLNAELERGSVGVARIARLLILRLNFYRLQVLIDESLDRRRGIRRRYEVALWREKYYIARLTYLIAALFFVPWGHAAIGALWYLPALFCIAYLVFFDMLIGLVGSAFVWHRHSIDPFRSLLLSLMNYAEMTVTFAILYLRFDCLSVPSATPLQALYFSAVTATTVGFGDIYAADANALRPDKLALLLVMLQLAVFVLFALVILNTFLARAIQEPKK